MTTSVVTGGAGFIGSHLVRALLERGDRVRVFDNFSSGSRRNLEGLSGVEVVEGDLRSYEQVAGALRGAELVFHLAAFVSVPKSMAAPRECFEVNVAGTFNVLEAARQGGAQHVVLASSAAVYGDSQELPLRELTKLRPLSPYAVSKLENELYARLYTQAFGLNVTGLRFFNVFGPRQSPASDYAAAIPIFTRRMLDGRAPTVYGDGLQTRDFIFVEDVARANLAAAGNPAAAGEVFNVCTGQAISLLDLLDALAEVIPGSPEPQFGPPRPGDIVHSLGSPERAAQALGFRPQVSLVDGLAHTVAWMREKAD